MRIGFVQFNPAFRAINRNLDHIVSIVDKAHADLLVLPELCTTGYAFSSRAQVSEVAEEIPGGTACRVFRCLASLKKMHIVAGISENKAGKVYNTAVLF